MKLTRLEIFGFKSFAKKLDLKLAGGITAVVGPNGCGKTNVVDAIRWVLGEQRPSQIRLDRMEDVLFKGSDTRRQLGMSEVSLTIDNDSGLLPLNMPEVTITRRLYRSGESDYMINKKSCRLVDINDILMDTGMGTDSYSLFEQSMINSILSNKTEDRRHIFEEAAGVTKYKARRKSALNKLIGIEDDLNRVGDIISELMRRVESLKRQAYRAKRYRELKNEIITRTVSIAANEIGALNQRMSRVTAELNLVHTSAVSIKKGLSEKSADIEQLSVNIVNAEKELDETIRLYNESILEISGKEKEHARFDSRLESLREIKGRAHETAERNTDVLKKLTGDNIDRAEKLSDVNKSLEALQILYGDMERSFNELRSEVAEKSEILSELELSGHDLEQSILSLRTSQMGMDQRRLANESRLQEITDRLEEQKKLLAEQDNQSSNILKKKFDNSENIRRIEDRLKGVKLTNSEQLDRLKFLDTKISEARDKQSVFKAEKDFLADFVRSFEGHSDGIRYTVSEESLKEHVFGILADFVSADDKYRVAVEAALTKNLDSIVVDTTDIALSGIRILTDEKRGRASFLPLDQYRTEKTKLTLPTAPGVIGWAHDFVKNVEQHDSIVERLLYGVIIVNTIDTALHLHKLYTDMDFVTLNGEMIGASGEIHGGRIQEEDKSRLGRMERLSTLTGDLEKTENEIQLLQKNREETESESEKLTTAITDMEKELKALQNISVDVFSSEARVLARKEAYMGTVESLNSEALLIQSSFAAIESKANTYSFELKKFEEKNMVLKEEIRQASSELTELRVTLDKQRSTVGEFQVERATLTEKKASLTRELAVIVERSVSLENASTRTQEEIENAERESLDIVERKKKLNEELEILAVKHEGLREKKDEIERRYSDLRSERSDLERGINAQRREIDDVSRKESSLTLERDETEMMINNIYDRLSGEYFIKPEDVPTVKLDGEYDAEQGKLILADMRSKLHTIGDVNLSAETDYNEEKKRLDFLQSERDDLVVAGDKLKVTIEKINQIAKARFTETFEKIRMNFKELFAEFFDGGVCDLELNDSQDPLEADIRITARPPGKNVKAINLLSSGERALTAISMLFAIYLVKPSPFCILDEVDAPLDDANLDRFLKVIKDFSKKTQFIIVTHNKKTMSKADNLYGITMNEPGLSSLISVRLSEVDSIAEENDSDENEENLVETAEQSE